MAIARDSYVIASSGTASSLTWSHTTAGTDRILIVFAYRENGETVTGITYNGVAMTSVTSVSVGTVIEYAYYLINPASGANNVVVSFSGSTANCIASSISYTGAKQTGQPDAFNSTSGLAESSLSMSVTTVADNSWITGALLGPYGAPFAGSGAFTYIAVGAGAPAGGAGWNAHSIYDTNGAITPAAATTVGASAANVNIATLVGVSIAPAADAATATPRRRTLLGIGS